MPPLFWNNLNFEYVGGDVTPVKVPNDTGWRQMPWWVIVLPVGNPVSIETRDGKIFCEPESAVLTRPNQLHRFTSTAKGDYISYWSHVRFTLPGKIDAADFLKSPLIVGRPVSDRIKTINAELADLKNSHQPWSIKYAARFLELGFSLFSAICSVSEEMDEGSFFSPEANRIREVLLFIDNHLHEALGRDQLARQCGLSPARFHVVFEKIVGLPPMAFVKRQRIMKSQVLLAKTQQTVKEIGGNVGYPDPYTFSRAFKNTVGISPQTYRTQLQNSIPM